MILIRYLKFKNLASKISDESKVWIYSSEKKIEYESNRIH